MIEVKIDVKLTSDRQLLNTDPVDIFDALAEVFFDDESVTILIEQEIDKIMIEVESGKIKLIKPDLSTFSALVTKYGIKKIARANQVQDLYQQQVKDGAADEFIV